MSVSQMPRQSHSLEGGVEDMRLVNGGSPSDREASRNNSRHMSSNASTPSSREPRMKSSSQSPVKNGRNTEGSTPIENDHEIVGGEVTVSTEPGKPPKLSRSTTQKIKTRPPPLFKHVENKTEEARSQFESLKECNYCNRYIGSTEHGSMDCDCVEEWDGIAKVNAACGASSDCINRATKMECVGDCGCGAECQNQRFQQRQYAPVTVFKTDKKGYGLRADEDLSEDDFIFEYIGEVITEFHFRKRMVQYDDEGIKHFYFMSLTQGEFIDATKKGNLGRFCNHSCNPNCYVDKWVVGDKLRMGIFAQRTIQAGEELTFNYNVDRYGADPQPCYCGEPNCTGYIGGKTQTERATKLSHTTMAALGIDDGDGWDTAVAKKPRKKKVGEDDEEYVNKIQSKSLDEHEVTKVMATLMQCKEKWITVRLLERIQRSDDEKVRNRVVKMHGYQILNTNLALWKEDANVVLQIFDILDGFPRLTRNKIADSKIETTVEGMKSSDDDKVASKAVYLLGQWANLEVGYRIPRKKREVDASTMPEKLNRFARRGSRERHTRSRSRSTDEHKTETPKGPSAPSGPRNNVPQRQNAHFSGPRPPFRPRQFYDLPSGWYAATDEGGRTYYYDMTGKSTWQRPTTASAPPPPPPKPTGTNKALEDIINEITSAKAHTPKEASQAPTPSQSVQSSTKKVVVSSGKEKWRSLPEEKQMKLYENTLFPHVKYVMDKFKGKLPKDDLKRFAKEISKKLVMSDFKNNRVGDPTKIDGKKEKQVKAYVKEYFDKAAKKHKEREERRAERRAKQVTEQQTGPSQQETEIIKAAGESGDDDMMMSEEEENSGHKIESSTPLTPMDIVASVEGLKRKRAEGDNADEGLTDMVTTPSKVMRSDTTPPLVPPPPPQYPKATAEESLDVPTFARSPGHSSLSSRMEEEDNSPKRHETAEIDSPAATPPSPPAPSTEHD